ncbi:MAG: DUF6478 family protein [Pseudomonadota bacterium]
MMERYRRLDWLAHERGLRRWRQAAREVGKMEPVRLQSEQSKARRLRHHLNEFLSRADDHLAPPMIGSNAMSKPHGTDWSWRPEIWRERLSVPGHSSVESQTKLGEQLTLFHDCERSELTLRQIRNMREVDLSPFGLRMDVFSFDGSFLSIVLDLPDSAVNGLKKNHLIRVNTIIELEKPLEIFVRLNVRHGPNTEQLVRELPLHEEDRMVEFDLAYTRLNEKRIERAWVDIIFENPEMNQVILRDLTFGRRPRAEF